MPRLAQFAFLLFAAGAFAGGQQNKPALDPLARGMLEQHNAIRARMRLPRLEWSETLARLAREWARTLVAERAFFHRPHNDFGENLFQITDGVATPEQVVGAWAAEGAGYDYTSNGCRGSMCGHYTQLVWRDTRKVGCARARGVAREVWVCNYDPPGNVEGQRPYQVNSSGGSEFFRIPER
jgi:pathogenesis-related protein 1